MLIKLSVTINIECFVLIYLAMKMKQKKHRLKTFTIFEHRNDTEHTRY